MVSQDGPANASCVATRETDADAEAGGAGGAARCGYDQFARSTSGAQERLRADRYANRSIIGVRRDANGATDRLLTGGTSARNPHRLLSVDLALTLLTSVSYEQRGCKVGAAVLSSGRIERMSRAGRVEETMLQDAIDGVAESVTGTWGVGLIAVAAGAYLLAKTGKPAAKGAIKGWFAGRDKVRELSTSTRGAFAEVSERIQDLYAEARA